MDNEDRDRDLQNLLDELNDDKNIVTFNRKYFDNNDSATPQNTPSAKKTADFSLKNVDFSKYFEEQQNQYSSYVSNDNRNEMIYCDTAYIGNGGQEVGCTQNSKKQKICNSLLCTKCDVKVSMFKNKRWSENCDYLFFRNNYGDQIKLSDKLVASPGNMCYSCQCSWLNVEDKLLDVDTISSVNWTCGGHHSR